jgi:3-dehydroquinate synthase
LNYGHTVGHAIESFFLAKSQPITHGNAIGWGIILENRIAVQLEILSSSIAQTIENRILGIFDPLPSFSKEEQEEIFQFMLNDKKNKNGVFHFSLIQEIGDCLIQVEVSEEIARKVISV